jgi:hypothetical protein
MIHEVILPWTNEHERFADKFKTELKIGLLSPKLLNFKLGEQGLSIFDLLPQSPYHRTIAFTKLV